VLVEQALNVGRWLPVCKDNVGLSNAAQAHHGFAAEFEVVCTKQHLIRVGNDGLGNPNLPVIKIEKGAIIVNTADADNAEVHLELIDKISCRFTNNTTVPGSYFAPGNNHVEIFLH